RPAERLWAGIGLHADGTVDFTAGGSRRLDRWLRIWVALYLAGGPPYNKIDTDDQPVSRIIKGSLPGFVLKGFERIAAAKLGPTASNDDVKEEGLALSRKRYDYLRKTASREQD